MTEALNPPRMDAFFIWSNTHRVMMPRKEGHTVATLFQAVSPPPLPGQETQAFHLEQDKDVLPALLWSTMASMSCRPHFL